MRNKWVEYYFDRICSWIDVLLLLTRKGDYYYCVCSLLDTDSAVSVPFLLSGSADDADNYLYKIGYSFVVFDGRLRAPNVLLATHLYSSKDWKDPVSRTPARDLNRWPVERRERTRSRYCWNDHREVEKSNLSDAIQRLHNRAWTLWFCWRMGASSNRGSHQRIG